MEPRKINIPIEVKSNGQVFFLDGQQLDLVGDTAGDLIIDQSALKSDVWMSFVTNSEKTEVLAKGTTLLVALGPGISDDYQYKFSKEECVAPAIGKSFVPIVLKEPLRITTQGLKSFLEPVVCYIQSLNKTAMSVNHAYTLLSEHFEKNRRSHTGSVFKLVYYRSENCWMPLEKLRK